MPRIGYSYTHKIFGTHQELSLAKKYLLSRGSITSYLNTEMNPPELYCTINDGAELRLLQNVCDALSITYTNW